MKLFRPQRDRMGTGMPLPDSGESAGALMGSPRHTPSGPPTRATWRRMRFDECRDRPRLGRDRPFSFFWSTQIDVNFRDKSSLINILLHYGLSMIARSQVAGLWFLQS